MVIHWFQFTCLFLSDGTSQKGVVRLAAILVIVIISGSILDLTLGKN